MPKAKQKLVIIDSNALIHRAFHALPPLSNKAGQLTNAIYGFALILIKTIKDLKPDYLVAAFDTRAKTFRHKKYQNYKAKRIKPPEELYQQIPIVKEMVKTFNVPIFEKEGFEADDLIATIAHLKSVDKPEIETIIVTGDQDVLQLVDDNTKVLSPHKGLSETIIYDEKTVREKFGGLTPKQLIDYKALAGDPSDNIPGVRGIGSKGAINLLNEFGLLEIIYQNLESPKIKERTKNLLIQNKKEAFLSKKLVTLINDVPLNFNLNECEFKGFNQEAVVEIFQRLNFKRLLSQISGLGQTTISTSEQTNLFNLNNRIKPKKSNNYQLINQPSQLKKFLNQLKKQKKFCFDTETTSLNPFSAELLGISFCWQEGSAYYLAGPALKEAKKQLAPIFFNKKIKKIGHNLKYDLEILEQFGLKIAGIYFDTMIASYLLNPGQRQHNLDTLIFVEFGHQMQKIEELIGKGREQISLAEVPTEKICQYSGEDTDFTWRLYQKLSQELKDQGMFGLFSELEMPLVKVLGKMETWGVKIDEKKLNQMSKELTKKINQIEKEVHQSTGEKFNLASPKQLKEILFDKLKISTQGLGKTKTGISTAAAELEKLKGKHKIIDLILEYRELTKLKNTYLDALPRLINQRDGRVHTSFNQTITATGRLSSSDPNLQNIPIRTEVGQKIRQAFIADKDYLILKADYSQIELRIIASLANDRKMLEAFNKKIDIHTQTAAAINDLPIEKVTPTLRRQAKEVNFGIIYGMGAWGLAQRTGISNQQAQEFINKYFKTYKNVKKYIDETLVIAQERGYVETLYGRRRYLPEINSGVSQIRSAAERMAINMPIQGTAADLIKLAMIKIDQELTQISSRTKMIIQVHDELVFEVPKKEIKKITRLVEDSMNQVYKLRAPIETEIEIGPNWGQTEKIKI